MLDVAMPWSVQQVQAAVIQGCCTSSGLLPSNVQLLQEQGILHHHQTTTTSRRLQVGVCHLGSSVTAPTVTIIVATAVVNAVIVVAAVHCVAAITVIAALSVPTPTITTVLDIETCVLSSSSQLQQHVVTVMLGGYGHTAVIVATASSVSAAAAAVLVVATSKHFGFPATATVTNTDSTASTQALYGSHCVTRTSYKGKLHTTSKRIIYGSSCSDSTWYTAPRTCTCLTSPVSSASMIVQTPPLLHKRSWSLTFDLCSTLLGRIATPSC